MVTMSRGGYYYGATLRRHAVYERNDRSALPESWQKVVVAGQFGVGENIESIYVMQAVLYLELLYGEGRGLKSTL